MEHIGLYQLKTHVSEIARQIEEGESFILTKNDRPIAKLVPYDDNELEEKKRRAREAMEKWEKAK